MLVSIKSHCPCRHQLCCISKYCKIFCVSTVSPLAFTNSYYQVFTTLSMQLLTLQVRSAGLYLYLYVNTAVYNFHLFRQAIFTLNLYFIMLRNNTSSVYFWLVMHMLQLFQPTGFLCFYEHSKDPNLSWYVAMSDLRKERLCIYCLLRLYV